MREMQKNLKTQWYGSMSRNITSGGKDYEKIQGRHLLGHKHRRIG